MNTIEVPREFIDWAESEARKDYQQSSYQKPTGKTMWLQSANKMAIASYRKLHSLPPSPVGEAGARWVKANEKLPLHKAHWNTGKTGAYDNVFPVRINGFYSMGDIYDESHVGDKPKYMVKVRGERYYEDQFNEIEWLDEFPNPSRAGETKRIIPEGSYFVAQCEKCGFKGASSEWKGGGQIADTGDYGDCYCPVCGQVDVPEADDDIYIDQRELFMKTIDELNGRISDLSWKAEAKKMDREGEISPVSAIKERIKEMLAKSKKEWATSDDHGQYKYSSGYEDALLELLKYLDEIPPTTAPEKCVCVDKIGDNAGCTHPNCSRYAQTPAPEVKEEKKHIHVALPGGAMANVSPDSSPALLDALNRMVNLAKNAPAEQPALPDPKTECTCICGPTDADPNCAWPNCFKSDPKGEITGDNLREWAIEESKHLAQRDKDFFFLGVGQLWQRVGPQISALVKELGNAATLTKERDNLIASVEGWEGKYHQAEAELDEAKKTLTQRSEIIRSLNKQLEAATAEKGEYREALYLLNCDPLSYEVQRNAETVLALYPQPDQTTKP